MEFSAKQAAKQVGKATATITRAIKSGKLSARRLPSGGYVIQASELFRVYPVKGKETSSATSDVKPFATHDLNQVKPSLNPEVEILQERLKDKDEVIEDLRKRLDNETEERRAMSRLLLEHKPKKRGFLGLFRKKD